MKTMAKLFNMLIICFVVGFTSYHWNTIRAQEQLRHISKEDRYCLAQNIYFEARNQTVEGQVAVAWVTLNRVTSKQYPNTICSVVRQAKLDKQGNPIRHQCQFSWYCDGRSDRISSSAVAQRAWKDAQLIANAILQAWAEGQISPIGDATMYHADYVNPYWSASYTLVHKIDNHIFYE